jgi:hypothetical protein
MPRDQLPNCPCARRWPSARLTGRRPVADAEFLVARGGRSAGVLSLGMVAEANRDNAARLKSRACGQPVRLVKRRAYASAFSDRQIALQQAEKSSSR